MEAVVKWMSGMEFVGQGPSGKQVSMSHDGPTPMELLLLGVGGCTGMDLVSILEKKRVAVDGFEIRLKAGRSENHPRRFTRVELEYIFYGQNLPLHHLERSVQLSQEKYCSAAATFREAVELAHSVKVVDSHGGQETDPQGI